MNSDDLSDLNLPPRPTAPFRTETFRPEIVGDDAPRSPFPIWLNGPVQRGFGRGGRDLGCHTANLPDDALEPMTSVTQTGIYFGYARVSRQCSGEDVEPSPLSDEDLKVWPMVMSLGRNPYYKNVKMTAEVHVIHEFSCDFYGHHLEVVALGYIRPELDYPSQEALIEDIQMDIKVAIKSLERPAYQAYASKLSLGVNGVVN